MPIRLQAGRTNESAGLVGYDEAAKIRGQARGGEISLGKKAGHPSEILGPSGPQKHGRIRNRQGRSCHAAAGLRARMNAPMARPPICLASTSASKPAPWSKVLASSSW